MRDIEFHEAANIFPLDEEHLDELAQDIKKNGLRVPIELLDGLIIDGRRRQLACNRAGVEPKYRDIKTDDPVEYVLSLNLHRRHLTTGQAGMAAAKAKTLQEKLKADAASRKGRRNDLRDNCPAGLDEGRVSDKLGERFGVSGKSVQRAAKVLEEGIPELVEAVEQGKVAVNKAKTISEYPQELQKELLNEELTKEQKTQHRARPTEKEESNGEIKSKGVGIARANEAINCLTRIPKNDALRKQGFRLVKDWIRRNP